MGTPLARWLFGCLVLVAGVEASAHGMAPLLLQIESRDGATTRASLKSSITVPGTILPSFPQGCDETTAARTEVEGSVRWTRWLMDCPQSPNGTFEISVPNLDLYTVVARYQGVNGHQDVALLSAGHSRHFLQTGAGANPLVQLWNGVKSGYTHLLVGTDHVLFIIGLCLWLRAGRALLIAVTAFTVGHSVTLLLVSLELLALPIAWAELAIAASIVALALKLVNTADQPPPQDGWTLSWLPLGFGLLHGMGFASALNDAGLQRENLLITILGFNLGIEAAQLLCVFLILTLLLLVRRLSLCVEREHFAQAVIAYGIGGVAVFWCMERAEVIAR